ncbi:alpha/beta hydrolase [Janibacter sp. Soil728]|uniref:alpha/beta fold hydrolase n=1 Tax=Janibacter sp. Soil728 TaxID=1736393 RepID=UPI0006F49880|nr:alpha/beta hydrolase [Janibacter sp. Soil728]KRE38233.1 alpha/beta hydrolase [Janibacter sp. Soil728]
MSATTTTELTYESTSRMVQTRRWNIHINEAGSGEPLILLHGSGPGATGWSNFSANIPQLAQHYRVIAVDMPGWGESEAVTWQERDHSTALLDLMDALELDKATIIGNSMGGGTTLRFGYEHPERVHRLITMGSSSGAPTLMGAAGLTEGLKVLQKGYRKPSFDTMRELVDVMTFDSKFATDELIQGRADMVTAHPEHAQNFIDGTGKKPVVELDHARLREIAVPTLLFHGRDDRVVHFEHSLRLTSLVPNSRLYLINGCGHWLQIEHAQEFTDQVLHFLRNS